MVGPPKHDTGDSGSAKEFITLVVEKVEINEKKEGVGSGGGGWEAPKKKFAVIFTVSVNVGGVAFTFLQYRNTDWRVNDTPSKRFLRIEINKLPDINIDIPLIGKISPPFDEMYFMWVQDGSKTTASGDPPGFTKAEIKLLNHGAHNDGVLKNDPILYKLTKDKTAYKSTDVLTEAGCHFVLVLKGKDKKRNVVMDYVWAKPKPNESAVPPPADALRDHARAIRRNGYGIVIRSWRPSGSETSEATATGSTGSELVLRKELGDTSENDNPADSGGGTKKTALKKSIGPFSISNIGLRFSNSILSICLDASVLIGPIGMAMQGFSINLKFKDTLTYLPSVTFSLEGLAVSFQRDPLTIAGGLIHQKINGDDYYAGGVDIGFQPWEFIAAGGYGELKDKVTKKKFTTTFIFAQLDGPLITLEYAIISGITGGFGYNNSLKLPTIAEVPKFPFLHMPKSGTKSESGNSTLKTLTALIDSAWFKPQDGSFWVGAGLTVTAFQMLAISAVLVVEWDPEVKLGIYAVAVADVPMTESKFKIVHVELGILATIDFGKGVAQFEAQLAPSSFILDPKCHLSGGFALYYWFKDGPQQTKGDWVFTLGGYNPAYTPPVQYPRPPRLQISWSVGPVSITGQAYFAITPNVCMVGGKLHASLKAGVLEAFFDAFADFLINYHPFAFRGDSGVSVGVRYKMDRWFVTVHISVEISATLEILGPPVHGTVHVNFWVFGFNIDFGSDTNPNKEPATLAQFCDLVLQKGSPTAAHGHQPLPHLFVCESGLLPSSTTKKKSSSSTAVHAQALAIMEVEEEEEAQSLEGGGDNNDRQFWEVKGGIFTFAIKAVFAISSVTVYFKDPKHPINYIPADTVPIYSRPMHLDKPMTSKLSVYIEQPVDSESQEVSKLQEDSESQWELRQIVTAVPKALWDLCMSRESHLAWVFFD